MTLSNLFLITKFDFVIISRHLVVKKGSQKTSVLKEFIFTPIFTRVAIVHTAISDFLLYSKGNLIGTGYIYRLGRLPRSKMSRIEVLPMSF